MHRSEFLKTLKNEFPKLKNEINKQRGMLHLEMNVFHNFAQEQLLNHDENILGKCFQLANMFYINGSNKLQEAVDVSFVEGLAFEGNEWAWKIFPVNLKKLYENFHGRLKS